MRSAALVFGGVVVAGVIALGLTAVTDDRDLAFTIGVNPAQIAASLEPGREVCQEPIDVSERFSQVQAKVGTFRRPGPPLEVAVRDFPTGRTVAEGTLPGGYRDNSMPVAPLQTAVPDGARVSVCVRNAGRAQVVLYGGAGAAARTSTARTRAGNAHTDLTLIFKRDEDRAVLSLLPTMFERASLFHPGWAGPWLFWTLLAAVLLLLPLLVWRALAAASEVRSR